MQGPGRLGGGHAHERGVEHVALGSDFNGTIEAPFDVTGLPQLTEGLLEAGFNQQEIAAIMGGNVLRLLLANLPDAAPDTRQ